MAKEFSGWRLMATEKGKVELTPWKVGEPPAGKVVVQELVSMVSPGTELSRIHDTHMVSFGFPCAFGYLSSGKIVAVGEGVTGWKVGDRVLAPFGHMSYGVVDVTKPSNLIKVPDNVPLEKAVYSGLVTIPMRGALCGRIKKGQTAVVVGQGIIGLFAAWWCKYYGASKVVVFDKVPTRLARSASFGADVAVDPGSNMFETLKGALGDRANVVIDATGTPFVIANSFELTKDNGTVVVLGGVHKPVTLDLYSHFQKRNLTLIGAGYASPEQGTGDEYENRVKCLDLIASGQMPVEKATSHFVPVQEAPKLYRMMVEQPAETCGVLFKWAE